MIGAPIGIAGVVVAILALGASGDHEAGARKSSAHVKPIELVVHNGIFEDHPPTLELFLHNLGRRRAVLTRARIEVLRVGLVRQCVSQGDLPLSTTYAATIPADAKPGDAVEVSLHEQLGGDQADRFAIALGIRANPASSSYSTGKRMSLPGPFLFELAISLVGDAGRRPLAVGRALVSIPFAPIAPEFYWSPASESQLKNFGLAEARARAANPSIPPWPSQTSKDCWRSNTRTLRRMLSSDATRSPTLDATASKIVTPDIAAIEATSG